MSGLMTLEALQIGRDLSFDPSRVRCPVIENNIVNIMSGEGFVHL